MSKMDNLRAMREARYDRAVARGAENGGSTPSPTSSARRPEAAPVRPAAAPRSTTLAVVPDPPEPEPTEKPTEELCGHRNMSGRTCTREAGHAAKSHRYS
jgi:hypothetical protein